MNIVDCFGTDGAELYIFFLSVSAPSVPNYIYIYIYIRRAAAAAARTTTTTENDGRNHGKTTEKPQRKPYFYQFFSGAHL